MPEPRRLMSVISGTLAVVAWIALAPMPAHALTAKQVRALLSSQHGVKVLKLRSTVRNGRAVFIATVMNAGGDFNDAFQVTTLGVDARTGVLISGFRHRASGLDSNPAPSYTPNRQSVGSLRQGFTWR